MRVEVHSVADFIKNLDGLLPSGIVEKTIWVDQTRQKISEARYSVNLQASCVVNIADGQFLLLYGEDCGIDYEDAVPELKGTESAGEKRKCLEEWCELRDLMVRPGLVDF